MRVVEFDRTQHNGVLVDETHYFLLAHEGHKPLLCSGKCPHRGGPLFLGTGNHKTGSIKCPWHETTFPRAILERQSVPTVIVGNRVTAVFDVPEDAGLAPFHHERIIANERS
ncbi:hypothetical protein D9623_13585 [Azospirillum brasilense]|uniref:Rieske 2Fe-2S domain-containing protein n=2 Tax=Azospirillum TaxID=191 RepID=A0A4D8QN69_AZOBR|nr:MULTISPECIES: Rieske 2Fe-2S domain-containing protein [Azospirillum]ALJ34435.1 hypothetical protein AMK58_02770 [Azospirillum brasilense]MDW7557562.1 Rieske 2Fe-2S domain-containing protein [Azospirillum brasilense]MDW7597240.1 Rieske 2Fe-2S domain-containing protein [Azospirillum brasilense]MDW7632416.1 Rieske 2Fe-2S domain-containing protein [Azospirillum brasilense]MDX5953051.1 Rieske 2Fe-2S domain-containing protein [Azospirillum brasilense]